MLPSNSESMDLDFDNTTVHLEHMDTKLNDILTKLDTIISWINVKFGNDEELPPDLRNLLKLVQLQGEAETEEHEVSETQAEKSQEFASTFTEIKIENQEEEDSEAEGDEIYEDPQYDPLAPEPVTHSQNPANPQNATSTSTHTVTVTCTNCYITYTPAPSLFHKCKKPFKCPICSKTFPKGSKLKRHMIVHQKPAPPPGKHACSHSNCNKSYSQRGSLLKHWRSNHAQLRFKCNVCNKPFTQSASLRRHLRTLHNIVIDGPILREIGSAPTTEQNILSSAHSDSKPFPCPESACPFTFPTNFRLQWHLRLAHKTNNNNKLNAKATANALNKAKKFKRSRPQYSTIFCTQCDRTFKNTVEFQVHTVVSVCPGLHLLKCPQPTCSKTFQKTRQLTQHKRTHKDPRPRSHICPICTRSFRRADTLRKHKECVHSEERPFGCNVCAKSFKRKEYLQSHLKHTHGRVERPPRYQAKPASGQSFPVVKKPFKPNQPGCYICETCGRTFKYSHQLKVHSVTHTREKPYECKTCGSKFTQLGSLKIHRNRTNHWDEVEIEESSPPPPQASTSSSAQVPATEVAIFMKSEPQHIPAPNLQRFKCPHSHCSKAFKQYNHLQGHLRSHTNPSEDQDQQAKFKHICHLCGRNFSQGSSLSRHLKTVHKDVYENEKRKS